MNVEKYLYVDLFMWNNMLFIKLFPPCLDKLITAPRLNLGLNAVQYEESP